MWCLDLEVIDTLAFKTIGLLSSTYETYNSLLDEYHVLAAKKRTAEDKWDMSLLYINPTLNKFFERRGEQWVGRSKQEEIAFTEFYRASMDLSRFPCLQRRNG
jgi:uncharacterized protein YdaU (DUF1376 family)